MPCSSSAAVILPGLGGSRPVAISVYDGAVAICSMRNAIARIATAETPSSALVLAGRARRFWRKAAWDGSGQTWVWKMSWAASTAFVRIWPASCIDELRALDRHDGLGGVLGLCRRPAPGRLGGGVVWVGLQRLHGLAEHRAEARRRRRRAVARSGAWTGATCHSAPETAKDGSIGISGGGRGSWRTSAWRSASR